MNSLASLKLNPFQKLLDFDDLRGATKRMKLDEFHDYIASEIPKTLDAPLNYFLDEKNKKYGVEIFGNYRVEKVKKSPQLLLKIKNSQGVFDVYNHESKNTRKETIYGPPLVDYRWILDTFLNQDNYGFNSYLSNQSLGSVVFNLDHVVRTIKIAEFFDCVQYLNLELIFNLAMNYNVSLEFGEDVDSKQVTELFRYFIKETESIIPTQSLYESSNLLKLLKKEFKSLLNQKWKTFYTIKHDKLKLSSYVKFIQDCTPYMDKIRVLDKNSKPQLWYSFFFETAFKKLNDPNALSYANMVTNWDTYRQGFTFPQKSSLRNFNKLTSTFYLSKLITPINFENDSFGEKNWRLLMFWVTYGSMYNFQLKGRDARHFNENPVLNFLHRIANTQINNIGPQIAQALDFFLSYFLNLEKCLEAELAKLRGLYSQGLIDSQEFNDKYNGMYFELDRDLFELHDFLCHTDQNGVPVNVLEITPKTTFKSVHTKIKKWHDELAIKALDDLNSSQNTIYYHLLSESHQIGLSIITPLCDSHSISREGILMSHCVATFRDDVLAEKYVVFSIERQDERATLGIQLKYREDKTPFFVFSQCFKYANSLVSDELIEDAIYFIFKLNNHPEMLLVKGSANI